MKHKAGDRVKVREDLTGGEVYGGVIFLHCMSKFIGKEVHISKILEGKTKTYIWFQEDEYKFLFSIEMLEDATDINVGTSDKLIAGKQLTVQELVKELSKFDPDSVVVLTDKYENNWYNIRNVGNFKSEVRISMDELYPDYQEEVAE